MKKFTFLGIILLLIVGVGYLIFRNFNSSDQGKIYTNQEFGFSVSIPEGWSYTSTSEKAGTAVLAVQLKSGDGKIIVPIFVDKKSWDVVKTEAQKYFLLETIEETVLAGQPAIKIISKKKEINPGYNYRIKHSKMENVVLLGTAAYIKGDDLEFFHNQVEAVLNSIKFD